jgi:glucose-1-phosphate thymidylyltransferase
MIDHGAKIRVVDVAGWYDAGKLDTLLDTNRVMLEKGRALSAGTVSGSKIIEPVRIETGATVKDSTIGPYVVIGAGTSVVGSTLKSTFVGEKSSLSGCTLHDSMIGDAVVLEGVKGSVTLGDNAEIRL